MGYETYKQLIDDGNHEEAAEYLEANPDLKSRIRNDAFRKGVKSLDGGLISGHIVEPLVDLKGLLGL
ncbi:MAG: hypothetical protein ABIB79_01235 [archaeon]